MLLKHAADDGPGQHLVASTVDTNEPGRRRILVDQRNVSAQGRDGLDALHGIFRSGGQGFDSLNFTRQNIYPEITRWGPRARHVPVPFPVWPSAAAGSGAIPSRSERPRHGGSGH